MIALIYLNARDNFKSKPKTSYLCLLYFNIFQPKHNQNNSSDIRHLYSNKNGIIVKYYNLNTPNVVLAIILFNNFNLFAITIIIAHCAIVIIF